jgi:YfiH family protein
MFAIESSPLGRVVVAPDAALFYTTIDFDGRLTDAVERKIAGFIQDRFAISSTLTTCNQVHGATVQLAKREDAWRECDSCDALWSSDEGVALGIKVADCLPVTFVDGRVIVNIHSGWRGAVQRITAAAIDRSKVDVASASAWLGPSIRACCFEVGEEVVGQFTASYERADQFVDRSRAKPHIDLAGLTIDLLRERGFRAERIFDSGLCTRCDGSIFHSFRRAGKGGGRNLAIVAQ